MRHALLPAISMLFLLAACSDGSGSPAPAGAGTGGNPAVLAIVTAQMPNAIQSGYYYAQIRALGGTGPYTWTLNGILPTGLTLTHSTGQVAVIEGVPPNYTWQWLGGAAPPPPPPNTDDALPFDLQIADSAGNTTTRHFLIEVDPATTSRVSSRGVTDSTVGCDFSARFNAVGGVAGTYSWTISSGTLPPGLALAPDGTISGVPTASGLYSFTVAATDSGTPASVDTQALQILVNKRPGKKEEGCTTGEGTGAWLMLAGLLSMLAVMRRRKNQRA